MNRKKLKAKANDKINAKQMQLVIDIEKTKKDILMRTFKPSLSIEQMQGFLAYQEEEFEVWEYIREKCNTKPIW